MIFIHTYFMDIDGFMDILWIYGYFMIFYGFMDIFYGFITH